jgi:predicted PhzF superfamily epimerase YddE/YHI9
MTLSTRITDTEMTSDQTRHIAHVTETGSWAVSWLPNRVFTRNLAITAMTLAEAVAVHADDLADSSHKLWWHVDGWAAELGITGPQAVAEASLSPEDHAAIPRVRTLAPDAQPGRTGYLVALDKATGTARVRIGGETVTMLATNLQYADGGE